MYIEDMDEDMDYLGSEDSSIYITIEIVEYVSGASVTKTVIKKYSTSLCTMLFESLESLKIKKRPVDNFIQVVEGSVEIIIEDVSSMLDLGRGIVVPANTPYHFKPVSNFKMINTMVYGANNS